MISLYFSLIFLSLVSSSSFLVVEKLTGCGAEEGSGGVSVCLTLELFLSLIQPSEFITSNKTCLGILKKNVNSMRQKFPSVLFPNV